MKVEVNTMVCEGHGVCVLEAPEVFSLMEAAEVTLKMDDIPTELQDKVRSAVDGCPRQALKIIE